MNRKGIIPIKELSLFACISNALVSCVAYLGEMIYPAGLAVYYPYPVNSPPVWEVALALMLLAFISAGAFVWRRKHPSLLVGWLWYLGMLAPVIGLIQAGTQAHADRYTYLPQIGLYIAIAWTSADLCAAMPCRRMISGALGSIAIAAMMWCAWIQTSYWSNSETLWNRALAVTTDNAVAQYCLGATLQQKGEVDEAIGHFQKALEISPDFAEAHSNLGAILQQKGQLGEAIGHFQKALEINPDLPEARSNLGLALFQLGQAKEAIVQTQKALELQPANAAIQSTLAWMLATAPQAAARDGARAVQLATQANQSSGGNNPRILRTLAAAYAEAGEFPNAVQTAREALQLAEAQSNTGLAGSLRREIKLYEAGHRFEETH